MTTSADTSGTAATIPGSALFDEVCAILRGQDGQAAKPLCDFARAFFAKVPRRLGGERSAEDLAALIRGAFELLQRSKSDGVGVEVVQPKEEGWSASVTAIRATLGDRPFIVDTIREYLSGEDLPIRHYVYPVVGVVRDEAGDIVEVTHSSGGDPRSLVHCEVPEIPDAAQRERIREELTERLEDVVAATDAFPEMLEALDETVRRVGDYRRARPDSAADFEEIEAFLRWLREGHFVFLGFRAYDLVEEGGEHRLRVEPGTGLGILADEDRSTYAEGVKVAELTPELRRRVVDGPVLITSKTNAESTVHRRSRMDYIGVKKLSADGTVTGERRFLGLFTSKAYQEHADAIPILRRKLDGILADSGAVPGSHDYKEIITIFNSMPKEDLFQASQDELGREIRTVLSLLFSNEVQVSFRHDLLGRGVSVMVILPRGRFSGDVRHRVQDVLIQRFGGTILNYHLAMSAGDQARLHFYVSAAADRVEEVTPEQIAGDIRKIIRTWDDRLTEVLTERFGEGEAHRLAGLYTPALQDEYRAATLPEIAVQDLEELERLRVEDRTVAITLREPRGRGRPEAFRNVSVLKLYLAGERLVLSDFMPILDNAGLRVLEVTPFALSGEGLPAMMIYSFAVQSPEGDPISSDAAELLAESILAIRTGATPNDAYNALVLQAGLRWREVDVLRAYGNYAFQAELVPTRFGPARALARYPNLARLVVDFFHARFGDEKGDHAARLEQQQAVRSRITSALDDVATLADDRAIRRLVTLMEATHRTNFFATGGVDPQKRSGGVPYISLKIASGEVEELRRSRILYEIYVYSSRMEGIHFRGAPVSRGGIRWSDRPDDFRTEVLGLVQTQIVKNAVIVPGGSKGGFITKRHFDDRDEMMAEVAEQYRTLIRGMLDITDNIVAGEVVPAPNVVRYDGDDPYLVVAADKGTARLSDVANGVSEEYNFWLGDAFASGGSHGYDHKQQGITARGAWESVRRHFHELGKDVQTEPFTVAGIGDMSGDVFGNGMLLSRAIRLVAAFDHRHVFIDPDPDPATSYEERKRLFDLPRSSWEDYDRSKLSAGAMIVPRASKQVTLTPEARSALGIPADVEGLDGEALVRAVLCAPVELLWNGGIGTYVRDEDETNADVGDPSNDPVRVTAAQLRAKVIGEGGNLGMTQRSRIAYANAGGRLNTDALDNSAGVDMSDHEVNLKILLTPMVQEGEMEMDARNDLLEEMTDEVSRLVLHNNISQSRAVSLDEARSREAVAEFAGLISALERDKVLDRGSAAIPSSDELQDRAEEGLGLTRPSLSVLLAYAKLQAQAALLASELPDELALQEYLQGYFPDAAVQIAGEDRLNGHRLHREIVTTQVVNDLVDLMGATFLHRVSRDTGQPLDAVVSAWYVASSISGAAEIRADLERLEGTYPAETGYRWLFGLARVLERTTRWALANVDTEAPLEEVAADLRKGLSRLRGDFGRIVRGEDRDLFEARLAELSELGIARDLSERLITLRFLPELLDIMRVATTAETDPLETAEAYYLVAEFLGVSWLNQTLRGLPLAEMWDTRLAQAIVADLQRAHRGTARRLLEGRADGESLDDTLARFGEENARELLLYRELLEELKSTEHPSLAACAVAAKALADVAER